MIPLIEYLCHIFDVQLGELEDYCLENHDKVVEEFDKLPIYTSHTAARNPIPFSGLTRGGPATVLARGGVLGVNVAQVFYENTAKILDFKRLPCIIIRHEDFLGETYYPMELVVVERDPWWRRKK
ncbi:hypothetical protein AAVH_36021 [Aphelenchoides avenae]|nr:hypothetical protein AAVH_36021 [Aphelenchus avenae]